MEKHSCDRRLIYVTGKGGVGKTTVAAALGLAAAEAGRRPSSARSPSRIASRARSSARASPRRPRSEPADNLWAITIDPNKALQEWLAQAARRRRAAADDDALALRSSTSSPPRRARRELITIAKVWELAQLSRWDAQPHLRPRGRRRARLRPRPGDADDAAHVRRDRARRPDPPPGRQDPRPCSDPVDGLRRRRAARGDAGRRTLEPAGKLHEAVGLGLRGDHRQRRLALAIQAPPTA